MNMVERMARALAIHGCLGRDDWDKWAEFDREPYRAQSRAALSAAMEPTPGMVEAARAIPCDGDVSGGVVYSTSAEARAIWQAMCRAALDEGEG